MKAFYILFLLFVCTAARAQTISITGTVTGDKHAVAGATVVLQNTGYRTVTNENGDFTLTNIPPGNYILQVSSVGYTIVNKNITAGTTNLFVQVPLTTGTRQLDSVVVQAAGQLHSGFTRLHDVEGMAIYAGKKTEVVVMKDMVANKATNNSRQLYAKVAGLNIWENDGAGIQLAIGGRGLSPNRVSNFNTRQNGYDISADALGYPESYYTPPAEAVERIEIVRGAASLQYGTQFGGMINFKMNHGSDSEKIAINTRLTGGSYGFFNTATSVGGTVNKLNYYAFFQHKSGDGYRPNSAFNANTGYAAATYSFNNRLSVTAQYTHLDYLEHQPGGLTDADFAKNPRQSVRARNWFKVNWNLGAVSLDYHLNPQLTFNTRFFGLLANRQALGLLTFINRIDDGSDRNLYIDHYRNWGNESRLLYQYNIGNMPATALVGFRYYSGHTNRQQGYGNNGSGGNASDFTFTPTKASDSLRYSDYVFPNHNTAVFAENIFRITPKLNIIPGVRYENITTRAQGTYTNVVFDLAGNPINPQQITDNKQNKRQFLLGGIGFTYNLTQPIQLYANISQNYKALNFNDLRTLNPNLRVDSSLQDEKGYSADLGIRKSTGIFNFDASLFMIHYNNKIGSILSTDATNFLIYNLRTNVAESRHYGLETYAEADIWKWIKGPAATTAVSLFSNFSLISAKYIHSKESAIEGRRVEFVPDVVFKTGVAVRHNRWAVSYQFSYTGKQFTDATNATYTDNAIDGLVPAYNIMDLSADYRISKHFSLSGSLNNLANAKYFTRRADSYPGPGIVPADGRSFFLTLQARL
ncbi:TonB-dependent receptor [Deminuibacter soli]|uniref:TonB-dependent receptor n=2 Tax=Deminuibacter soli TaxID=2291815 RepID=A0A3E1NDC3_9BACT|nr:TonB-dependent receptor [Deminuibacter soli]